MNQAIVAFALLIGFVADLPLVAPFMAAALALVLAFGPRLESLTAPRPNAEAEIGLLLVGSALLLAGVSELGWALVLAAAFIAGLAAAAQIYIRRPVRP